MRRERGREGGEGGGRAVGMGIFRAPETVPNKFQTTSLQADEHAGRQTYRLVGRQTEQACRLIDCLPDGQAGLLHAAPIFFMSAVFL